MSDLDHTTTEGPGDALMADDVPSGPHPLEIAAREGYGPLSPLAQDVWHGQAAPCVSCGMLVRRDARKCPHCGQELTPRMLEKMRAHAGPWFVYEHLRPFPGVSLERIIRQIRRGLLMETSIVRGPATDFQWRFAVETPGLCRYFGKCWSCHGLVAPSDSYCQHCLTYLTFERPRSATPAGQAPPTRPPGDGIDAARTAPATEGSPARSRAGGAAPSAKDLDMLRAALETVPVTRHDTESSAPPTLFGIRAGWLALALLLIAVLALLVFTRHRSAQTDAEPSPAPQFVPDLAPQGA